MAHRVFISLVVLRFLATAGPLPAAETTEDVTFRADVDGTEQKYVLVTPENFATAKVKGAMIALHGHGSDRWQFVKDRRAECSGARDVAAAHGLLFVSPDYRAKTSWMGPKAEADVVQIIAEVKQKFGVKKIIVCGGSMGGTGALTFTALHPTLVDGVVSLNGTANLVDYPNFLTFIAESYGGTKDKVPDEYRKRSAEFFPEKFTMPIAATTGGTDKLVPPESVLRLMEATRKTNKNTLLIHRPTGGHSTNYADTKEAVEFVVTKVLGARE